MSMRGSGGCIRRAAGGRCSVATGSRSWNAERSAGACPPCAAPPPPPPAGKGKRAGRSLAQPWSRSRPCSRSRSRYGSAAL
eukprot:154735-Chlamydomonas_euryale.AAC.1